MKLLIVRVGALGDVLHALPAAAALKSARPDWTIDWVVDPRWAPLLVNSQGQGNIVSRVHLADTRMWNTAPLSWNTLRSIAKLRRALRQERYDVAVDVQGTLRSAVIGRFARAREFTGYEDPREAAAAHLYRRTRRRIGTHVVEQGAALLAAACSIALQPAPVTLPHEPWADDWAAELAGNRRICLLAPTAGWGAKQWPAERYGALAQQLRRMGFLPLVNAPKKDDPVASAVIAASGGAAEIAVCNVAGLIALTRRSSLVIGGDSGPTHLAAALAVPLVALYGPTDPARNGPWGDGPIRVLRGPGSITSHKRVAEIDAGLARITVDEVAHEVETLLAHTSAKMDR